MEKLMHIYCGEGKGKTTASVGLALRAAGAGIKTAFVQFLKGGESCEIGMLQQVPGITVTRCDREYGWISSLSDEDRQSLIRCHNELLENAFSGDHGCVILDEFNIAYKSGLIDRDRAKALITAAHGEREIVLTGRDPAPEFMELADYISEIRCVRHPYEKGVSARRGIEY